MLRHSLALFFQKAIQGSFVSLGFLCGRFQVSRECTHSRLKLCHFGATLLGKLLEFLLLFQGFGFGLLFGLLCVPAFVLFSIGYLAPTVLIGVITVAPRAMTTPVSPQAMTTKQPGG